MVAQLNMLPTRLVAVILKRKEELVIFVMKDE